MTRHLFMVGLDRGEDDQTKVTWRVTCDHEGAPHARMPALRHGVASGDPADRRRAVPSRIQEQGELMSDMNQLMADALTQLEDHKKWLAARIQEVPGALTAPRDLLVAQVGQVRLQLASVDKGRATVVYEYPDELYEFLRSETAPKELRDTLAGSFNVSTEKQSVQIQA